MAIIRPTAAPRVVTWKRKPDGVYRAKLGEIELAVKASTTTYGAFAWHVFRPSRRVPARRSYYVYGYAATLTGAQMAAEEELRNVPADERTAATTGKGA